MMWYPDCRDVVLLKYVVTIIVDDTFFFAYLTFLAQPSNNVRLLRMAYWMANQYNPCDAKYDNNNDDDVNEFNNECV